MEAKVKIEVMTTKYGLHYYGEFTATMNIDPTDNYIDADDIRDAVNKHYPTLKTRKDLKFNVRQLKLWNN